MAPTDPRTNAAYQPGPDEFDGPASPLSLASWERYLDAPLNPTYADVPATREQDAFTAGWDAGNNFGMGYATAIRDLNNASESEKS